MGKKLTYDYVYNVFCEKGYTLLSKFYKNTHTKLEYICDKGHRHSIRFYDLQQGHGCAECARVLLSNRYKEHNNPFWKGGVSKSNLPLYTTYAHQLELYHPVYKVYKDGLELLGVECTYCKKVYVPTAKEVQCRIESIITGNKERNLYCSSKCKKECPIFYRMRYPKNFKDIQENRRDQSPWSKIIKGRDSNTCQICGDVEGVLIAHHIEAVAQNPIESLDIDNGITVCSLCHSKIHKLPGCTYNKLKCTDNYEKKS